VKHELYAELIACVIPKIIIFILDVNIDLCLLILRDCWGFKVRYSDLRPLTSFWETAGR
jgi:hypothetical protein